MRYELPKYTRMFCEALDADNIGEFKSLLEMGYEKNAAIPFIAHEIGKLDRSPEYLKALLSPISAAALRRHDMTILQHFITQDRQALLVAMLERVKFSSRESRDGSVVLALAATMGRYEMVRLLLDAGARHNRITDAMAQHVVASVQRELDLAKPAQAEVPAMRPRL